MKAEGTKSGKAETPMEFESKPISRRDAGAQSKDNGENRQLLRNSARANKWHRKFRKFLVN